MESISSHQAQEMEMIVLLSLIVRIERILMELSVPIVERAGLVWKEGFKDFGSIMGEGIPGPGPCSTYTKGSFGFRG